MALNPKQLQMFLLTADKLVRCRWDGRSEHVELLNSALQGEMAPSMRHMTLVKAGASWKYRKRGFTACA